MSALLLILGCASSGCAAPDVNGTALKHSAAGAQATTSSDNENDGDEEEEDVLTPEKGDDSSSPASASAETTCAVSDLALCFTFEGSAIDQSAAPLQAAEATNLVFVAGKEGKGAAFGPASALRFNPDVAFDLPATSATVEAWIKRASSITDAVIFDDDARFSLTINAAGHAWCKSSGGAVTGATLVPVEEWVHVACVIDNGTLRAYVNGNVDATGPGGIIASPSSPAAIGGNAPFGEPFVGVLDSLRVFRTARTSAQILDAASKK